MPANPFETANRLVKAVTLADAIDGAGLTADDAASMTSEQWSMAASASGTRIPSQLTAQLVVLLLARREFARRTFAGKLKHAAAA